MNQFYSDQGMYQSFLGNVITFSQILPNQLFVDQGGYLCIKSKLNIFGSDNINEKDEPNSIVISGPDPRFVGKEVYIHSKANIRPAMLTW